VPLVLLSLLICDAIEGQPGDDCETLEVRASTCTEAVAWAQGWIPPGHVVAMAHCTEQRQASLSAP
jgi:hypothetical protein